MSKTHKKQAGFTVVEGLLVLVVLAALVFVGYFFMNKQKSAQNAAVPAATSSQVSDNEEGEDLLGDSATEADTEAEAAVQQAQEAN